MINFRSQYLPTLEPQSLETTGKTKNRVVVHSQGLWHPTVQAYIISRKNDGTVHTLVQKRSHSVDIAKNKHDQSIAIHINNNETPELALSRGLKEELNLNIEDTKWLRILSEKSLYISKTYEEDYSIFNRENLHLFLVEVAHDYAISVCSKIDSFYWSPWKEYVDLTLSKPHLFTKTSRFYIESNALLDQIEHAVYKSASNMGVKKASSAHIKTEKYHFISIYNEKDGNDLETLISNHSVGDEVFSSSLVYNTTELRSLIRRLKN